MSITRRTWIVVMDDGLAYDGVYAFKSTADMMVDFYKKSFRDHKFVVKPAPNKFSMRQRDRIHDFMRS